MEGSKYYALQKDYTWIAKLKETGSRQEKVSWLSKMDLPFCWEHHKIETLQSTHSHDGQCLSVSQDSRRERWVPSSTNSEKCITTLKFKNENRSPISLLSKISVYKWLKIGKKFNKFYLLVQWEKKLQNQVKINATTIINLKISKKKFTKKLLFIYFTFMCVQHERTYCTFIKCQHENWGILINITGIVTS